MLKRMVTYGLTGVLVLAATVFVAGIVVKKGNTGRIAPGIMLCGTDLSGMTVAEAEKAIEGLVPVCMTEVRCRFLPEMRGEIEARVQKLNRELGKADEALWENSGTGELPERYFTVQGNEVCVIERNSVVGIDAEGILRSVKEKSGEVKVWEWLYAAVTKRPYRVRCAEAIFLWEEELLREDVAELQKIAERDRRDATIVWESEQIKVTESRRGFRLETEALWEDAERVESEATERLQKGPVEGLVLRFYVKGTALMPGLSTAQGKECDTVIGSFTTSYAGAGNSRVGNIQNGAGKLHGAVILPGEEFSVAAALMPFTEANGYGLGGTYIDGQLSESIGGGVCQLSTTLYNALLQTALEITERHPHSLPVGYVPLGRDAAIAGDYKDLKFKNTTKAPVLLLCEAGGTEVEVTIYGSRKADRGDVTFESVVAKQEEDGVTVEVYRMGKGEDGVVKKERVSRDRYRRQISDGATGRPE